MYQLFNDKIFNNGVTIVDWYLYKQVGIWGVSCDGFSVAVYKLRGVPGAMAMALNYLYLQFELSLSQSLL